MDDPRPASIHSLSRRARMARPSRSRRGPPASTEDDAGRCLPHHPVGLPGPDDRQCRHAARWPLGRRPASVAGRLAPAGSGAGRLRRGFEQDWLEELRGRAKVLSSRLGPARDLDVFLGELLAAPAKALPARTNAKCSRRCAPEAGSARDPAWKAGQRLRRRRGFRACFWMMSRAWPSRACRWRRTTACRRGARGSWRARPARGAKSAAARPAAARKAICIACASR